MNSEDAAHQARDVFNTVSEVTFEFFGSRVDHEWAKKSRYTTRNIENELSELLAN